VAAFAHVLVVVRPLELLLEQYTLTATGRAMLEALAFEGVVVAARRVVRTHETYTLLAALTSPAELGRLASLEADLRVVSSVSESCLAQGALPADWVERLHRHTRVTQLGDVPRTTLVRRLRAAGVTGLRYGVAEFERAQELVPTEAVVLAPRGTDDRTVVFGSPNLALALRQVLEASDGIEATYDEELVVESPELQALLTRVADDEPWFETRPRPAAP
jgi:hypothetical protein